MMHTSEKKNDDDIENFPLFFIYAKSVGQLYFHSLFIFFLTACTIKENN